MQKMKRILLTSTFSFLVGFVAMAQSKAGAKKQKNVTQKEVDVQKQTTSPSVKTQEEKLKLDAARLERERQENTKAAALVDDRNK
jgi:hypothetical protein